MFFAAYAQGATINFGPAQQISGDSDVQDNGTIVRAYTFGSGNTTTVNGVTFSPIEYNNIGDSITGQTGGGTFTSPDTNSGISQAYINLIAGTYFTATNQATPETVTLKNLTPGNVYQVEVWVDDSRPGGGRSDIVSGDAGGTNTQLTYNNTNAFDGLGEYAIGYFTADSSGTQLINFTGSLPVGNTSAEVNGLELSQVPEPATAGLLSIGAFGLLARGRRVRAS
jgi:hypothetical protein